MEQPRRKIRRIVTRAALFLLLGAIINIAVAWGFALWVTPHSYRYLQKRFDLFWDWKGASRFPYYRVDRWQTIGSWLVVVARDTEEKPGWSNVESLDELVPRWGQNFLHIPELDGHKSGNHIEDPLSWGERSVVARGWPCLAVWGGIRAPSNAELPQRWITHGIIPFTQYSKWRSYIYDRFLPYLPLWPGFAINAIFYAAILWLLFPIPGWLRRRHRIKRGLCIACGYDLRASRGNCPECGAAIPASLAAQSS